jgi:hypothetical protein
MRKIFLVMLLALVSSNAMAGWVRIKNKFVPAYINTDTVSKNDNIAKLSKLYDYTAAQTDSHGKLMLSMIIHYEYDCESGSVRTLDFVSYSGNMGEGDVLSQISNPNLNWITVNSDDSETKLFKYTCHR